MGKTVGRHAVNIVNAKVVPQEMVYVTTAVDLDGRMTNVLKVLNNVYNILMFYFLSRRCRITIDIRN